MRLIIPKSQGKQPYYDARKSGWGDIFPHEPKNPPQEQLRPQVQGKTNSASQDATKRKAKHSGRTSYHQLENEMKEHDLDWKDKCFNVDSFQGEQLVCLVLHVNLRLTSLCRE